MVTPLHGGDGGGDELSWSMLVEAGSQIPPPVRARDDVPRVVLGMTPAPE
jgi:hypothetical protein